MEVHEQKNEMIVKNVAEKVLRFLRVTLPSNITSISSANIFETANFLLE